MAGNDFHLKIDGVTGESKNEGFEGQMQIESWSWGENNTATTSSGTGLTGGKVNLQDFHFVVAQGKSSQQLLLFCASGQHVNQAKLTCRKAGGKDGGQVKFLEVTFDDCMISSFQVGSSAGGDVPMEQVSISFTKITWEYFEQDTKSGATKSAGKSGWDAKVNKKV